MRRLWRSPTLRSVGVYGAAGAGFAIANLILARVLPPAEYAMVTLVVALLHVGFSLATAGVDGVVNRHHMEAGPRLLRSVLLTATAVAAGFALTARLGYNTSLLLSALTLVSIVAGGALVVAAAQFQSEQRFGPSLALLQSTNIVLLVAALIAAAARVRTAWPPILVLAAGTVVCAVWGWTVLLRERHTKPHRSASIPWGDALAFAGLQATGLLLVQLERLVIPHVLPLGDLATYGVLAAVAGSLFRVLQMSVGYTLLPRLRSTPNLGKRRRLVFQEARLVAGIVLLGSAAIWFTVPLVERWLLDGKYQLAGPLVLAVIVSGVAKVLNAFSKALSAALATPRELSMVNAVGWASIALALPAAVVGARWGLAGVIYGVALGWVVRAATVFYLGARHLRARTAGPVVASDLA